MHSIDLNTKAHSTKMDNRKEQRRTYELLPTYDMSLIGSLESDHEEIIKLYEKVLKSADNQEFGSLQLLLVEFATSFTDHIQIEDDLLYGYLKILAKNKSHLEQKIVSEFASEMKNIFNFNIYFFNPKSVYSGKRK